MFDLLTKWLVRIIIIFSTCFNNIFFILSLNRIRNSHSSDKKTFIVDSIWCTCQQSTVILVFNDFKKLCFIGRYCFYIIDLIGKNPVKNMNIENLTFFHLIKFCKHFSSRKTGMTWNNGVYRFSADRKWSILQTAAAFLKNFITCAIVDGQIYLQRRDIDIAHYPILLTKAFFKFMVKFTFCKLGIIFISKTELVRYFLFRHVIHYILIVRNSSFRCHKWIHITDHRI